MLCLHSKYFLEVISEVEKQSKVFNFTTYALEIPLPERLDTIIKSGYNTEKLMEIITRFIYNGGDFSLIKEQISDTNCYEILALADSIGMEDLSDSTAKFIGEQFINIDNCLKVYNDILIVKIFIFIYFYLN